MFNKGEIEAAILASLAALRAGIEHTVHDDIVSDPSRQARQPWYSVGDIVRIPDRAPIFSKGDTASWINNFSYYFLR